MALGSTQPLVKMSTRDVPGGKGGPCVKLTTYQHTVRRCQEIWTPLGLHRPVMGELLLCFLWYFLSWKVCSGLCLKDNVCSMRATCVFCVSLFFLSFLPSGGVQCCQNCGEQRNFKEILDQFIPAIKVRGGHRITCCGGPTNCSLLAAISK